jgi:hypothetical protein
MESHEWRERTDEGMRYFRANYQGGRWTFLTTLKTDPDWEIVHPVPVELWRELRDILWRKYQRKRGTWGIIEAIDKIISQFHPGEAPDEEED